MTEILFLKNNVELYGYAEEQNGKLFLYVHGKTLNELQVLLNDANNTATIVSKRNDGDHVYERYIILTEIVEISPYFVTATMEQA